MRIFRKAAEKLGIIGSKLPVPGIAVAPATKALRDCFDGGQYRRANPDVARAGIDPLEHFLKYGLLEGRTAPRGFSQQVLKLALAGNASAQRVRSAQKIAVQRGKTTDIAIDSAAVDDLLGIRAVLPKGLPVTLGIVLYNNDVGEIGRLLGSVARSQNFQFLSVRVTAINNGAELTEEMKSLLKSHNAYLLPNANGNIGSSAGHTRLMNHAFKESDSVAYFTMNPDGFFHPWAIERMVRMAYRHDWSSAIEAAQLPNENSKYVDPDTLETEWAVTACALFPKKIWSVLGGFDPHIFLYCDDVDYGWQIRHAGFFVRYCPWAYFFHDYASRTAASEFFVRNRLEAGRYLGHKWNNPKFRRMCEERLLKIGIYASIDEMPAIDELPKIEDPKSIPNFTNEFIFGYRRW